ncbi:polymer-forming cytoskeletal protein [Massilia sp. SR12]
MKAITALLLVAAPVFASAGPYTFYAGKNVELNQETKVTGNVAAGGNLDMKYKSQVQGNVTTTGKITLEQGSKVSGNIATTGTVHAKYESTVTGKVETSTRENVAVTLEQAAKVSNVVHNSGTIVDKKWGANLAKDTIAPVNAPVLDVLPGATPFAVGSNVFNLGDRTTGALGQGKYGKVNLGYDSTLTLGAGSYYFDSLDIGGFGKLIFDLSGGAINLYVLNNINIGQDFEFDVLNGSAANIYTETKGNYELGINGEWYGTLFGSGEKSNLHFGQNATMGGSFLARQNIQLDIYSTVVGLPSGADQSQSGKIPLPGSLPLLGLGLLALATLRRRK